ncbi:MAG: DUF559 domain-containing protein [bacterium]|nr:DUF559 domain-containing protein [bacterium]
MGVPAGSVQACAVPDILQLSVEPASLQGLPSGSRGMTALWPSLPPLEQILDQTLRDWAQAALSLWPHWYGLEIPDCHPDSPPAPNFPPQARHPIAKSWLDEAWRLAGRNHLPLVPVFPQAVQLSQLALAIGQPLSLFVIVSDPQPAEGCLLGLVRVTEWIAAHTHAAVLILVDTTLATHPELSSVLHELPVALQPLAPSPKSGQEEHKAALWPVIGRPHPRSPGEQTLARLLDADPELHGLFGFNLEVHTTLGSRYLVDCLWRGGGLVIEIDGYRFHSPYAAFRMDRHRDYELLISGYQVLRLDHEDVMVDGNACLEKIRHVVRYIQTQAAERKFR